MSLFGAAYAAPNKGTTIWYYFRSRKNCWILLSLIKFKDFSRSLSVFQVLFKANLTVKDFSRHSCIFKYFSSLCEACRQNMHATDWRWVLFTTLNSCKTSQFVFWISFPGSLPFVAFFCNLARLNYIRFRHEMCGSMYQSPKSKPLSLR